MNVSKARINAAHFSPGLFILGIWNPFPNSIDGGSLLKNVELFRCSFFPFTFPSLPRWRERSQIVFTSASGARSGSSGAGAGGDARSPDRLSRFSCRGRGDSAAASCPSPPNDDDALELFKKTLPGASASFVQVQVSSVDARSRALSVIQGAKGHRLDFIALAIQGKKIGFGKVIGMIDEMVATLKTEQQDDDHKKEYCAKQFDQADDKKKGLERAKADLETVIEDTKESIATTESDIKNLEKAIKALDKSVAEATEHRKDENEDFTELMASDSAAKELLGFAKNRLNKFYNPKLYKAPPKRVLSEEDRITVSMGGTLAPTAAPGGIAGTGVVALADVTENAKPPPPPEAPGAYKKKSEDSNGVIAMIDLLIKDLDKEMTVAQTDEKDAQADYETTMKDSAEKRELDSKEIGHKESAKAEAEAALQKSKA